MRKLRAKLEAVVREYAARAPPEENVPLDENVSRALGCKFGGGDRVHVGSAAKMIGEEQDIGVTLRRDWEGAEVVDADEQCRALWADDGRPDRQPRGFPCLALQAMTKPSPGADAHTNLPVETFEHSQGSRCAVVEESCRAASLHNPRAHEERYVSANRFIVQQKSRTSHRALRVGRGLWVRLADEKDGAVVGGVYPAFARELLDL